MTAVLDSSHQFHRSVEVPATLQTTEMPRSTQFENVNAIVLDIEGTLCPISFVRETLVCLVDPSSTALTYLVSLCTGVSFLDH